MPIVFLFDNRVLSLYSVSHSWVLVYVHQIGRPSVMNNYSIPAKAALANSLSANGRRTCACAEGAHLQFANGVLILNEAALKIYSNHV